MTYEELTKEIRSLEKKAEAMYVRQCKLREKYIEEHKPLHVKRFQRLTVKLRVTEKSRERMTEKERGKRKNQLGREYTVTGIFTWYTIMDEGIVRPCFYGPVTYSRYDEILSVELAKEQPEGDCHLCMYCKDSLCYMNGGQDISKSCASHKIKEGDIVCPKYEEVVPNGLYKYGEGNKHCPNVTKCTDSNGNRVYRVYSLNWRYYNEYSETEIWKFYSKDIKPKEEEK